MTVFQHKDAFFFIYDSREECFSVTSSEEALENENPVQLTGLCFQQWWTGWWAGMDALTAGMSITEQQQINKQRLSFQLSKLTVLHGHTHKNQFQRIFKPQNASFHEISPWTLPFAGLHRRGLLTCIVIKGAIFSIAVRVSTTCWLSHLLLFVLF